MRYLLSGVALAAVVATGFAAGAQTRDESRPKGSTATSATRHTHQGAVARTGQARQESDDMADQLNRQELERLQAGGQPSGAGSSQPAGQAPQSGGASTR